MVFVISFGLFLFFFAMELWWSIEATHMDKYKHDDQVPNVGVQFH